MDKNAIKNKNPIRYKTFSLALDSVPVITKGVSGTSNLTFAYKSVDYDSNKSYRFIGTSEVKDRDGEIVLLDGWDFSNYKNNPIVLWGHENRDLPIGKVTAILKDETKRVIYFDVEFSESYELGKTVRGLVEEGILRATSLGFRVLDWEWGENADAWLLTKCELFELSIVNVPANQEAIIQDTSKDIEDNQTKSVEKDNANVLSELREQIEALKLEVDALKPSSEADVVDGEPSTDEPLPKTEENDISKTEITIDEASVASIVEAVLAKLRESDEQEETEEPAPEKVEEVVDPVVEEPSEDPVVEDEDTIDIVDIADLDDTVSFVIINEEEN